MFGVLPAGVRISESFSAFTDSTLLSPAPVSCWPATMGQLAANIINSNSNNNSNNVRMKVMVYGGGAGRTGLELLRNCSDMELDHVDHSPDHYRVLKDLLDQGSVSWRQPLEGRISEERTFRLEDSESQTSLLAERNNTLSCLLSSTGRTGRIVNRSIVMG